MTEVSNFRISNSRVQTLNLLSFGLPELAPDLSLMLSRWEKATSR
jgi:hypothetical protein